MAEKFYITTPIYYVNASPHIGHSYTNIAADTLARAMRRRLQKENVWFLTGTDEHGQKIQKAADDVKLSPKEFVDKAAAQFEGLWKKLNVSYDDFIRTTQDRHIRVVQKALAILYKNGRIYAGKYEGWYCTPCETFWPKNQITDQFCPDCKRQLENISEESYFLKLSQHQDWLISYIEKNPAFIAPQTRRNEVLGFLKNNKLNDLCISRPKERLNWGIPLPFATGHVAYVWLDALVNYISAVGSFDDNGNYHSKWWDTDTMVVHLIGKDILRHHAIYWPIILKSLNIELPPKMVIFAHGWWLLGQDKMSKSRGNVVNPLEMADKFGVDTYRYFLLRDVPFGLDGNFSESAIVKRFNGDLANDLGNLVYRTLTMIEKYYQGVIPEIDIYKIRYDEKGEAIKESLRLVDLLFVVDFNFSSSLEKLWELVNMANKYVEETKPWNLAKENKTEELKSFIRLLVEVIRKAADELYPFMPQTAESIKEQIGLDKIKKGNPLFPRIE